MPVEMSLWKVAGSGLDQLTPTRLDQELRLEEWIVKDPSLLGMDIALIGRQVRTVHGARIDLLAVDRDANCIVLELKRDRTPREVVAQLLDYGAWVRNLGYKDLDHIAQTWRAQSLADIYKSSFGSSIPEAVNTAHSLIVVASELDESSERIISYLAESYSLSINAVFFTFFRDEKVELLGRAWLKDPIEIIESAEAKNRAPWSGYWYVNVGEGDHRNWDDNRSYNYVGAGQGEVYSRSLLRLHVGDRLFAYMKGIGYVGYGEVTKEAVPIAEFKVDELDKPLLDLPLRAPSARENMESRENSEWALGVRWLKAFDRDKAKTFKGAFSNSNIACRLRDSKTLEFLRAEFAVAD